MRGLALRTRWLLRRPGHADNRRWPIPAADAHTGEQQSQERRAAGLRGSGGPLKVGAREPAGGPRLHLVGNLAPRVFERLQPQAVGSQSGAADAGAAPRSHGVALSLNPREKQSRPQRPKGGESTGEPRLARAIPMSPRRRTGSGTLSISFMSAASCTGSDPAGNDPPAGVATPAQGVPSSLGALSPSPRPERRWGTGLAPCGWARGLTRKDVQLGRLPFGPREEPGALPRNAHEREEPPVDELRSGGGGAGESERGSVAAQQEPRSEFVRFTGWTGIHRQTMFRTFSSLSSICSMMRDAAPNTCRGAGQRARSGGAGPPALRRARASPTPPSRAASKCNASQRNKRKALSPTHSPGLRAPSPSCTPAPPPTRPAPRRRRSRPRGSGPCPPPTRPPSACQPPAPPAAGASPRS